MLHPVRARVRVFVAHHAALTSAREPEDNLMIQGSKRMLRPSIKRKIVGIATGMIILAVITSVMSMALASRDRSFARRVDEQIHPSVRRFSSGEYSIT